MLIIAHRGASRNAPENTLRAFEAAIAAGADMIECDVHVCGTGEVIVLHDDTLERTTNGHGLVSALTLTEIKNYHTEEEEKIPTLQETLHHLQNRIALNIELKGENSAQPTANLLRTKLAEGNTRVENLLISSFSLTELERFHRALPSLRIAPIAETITDIPWSFLEHNPACYSLHLKAEWIAPEIIAKTKQLGIHLFAWTVNNRTTAQNLKQMGVDGIFTDLPEQYVAYN